MNAITHFIRDSLPGRPALSETKLTLMRDMEARGVPRLKICAILGIDQKTARKYLGARKTWIRRPTKPGSARWAEIMKRLQERGMGTYQVAIAVGCPSHSPAQHWARGGCPSEKYREKLVQLAEAA